MKPVLPDFMHEIAINKPGGPEVLIDREVRLPKPAPTELLVRVEAAGVNRPDVLQRQGHYPLPPGTNLTPGLEIAGEVVALGTQVEGFKVGDRVCALTNGGGYAEYCVVPMGQALPIPKGMDVIQAAAIPETFFTVWANLFEIGGAVEGDNVLIHGGTSGIGTTALLLCKERGIKAFATAGSLDKCKAIQELDGEAINYRMEDFVEVVKERTDGRGVDIILDIMGAAYFDRNVAALAQDGRLIVIGMLGGVNVEKLNLGTLMAKRAIVTGSMMRSRTATEKAAIAVALRREVWPALDGGRCQPIIDQVFPFKQVIDAHRRMESGEHIGKIVLNVN